MSRAGLTGEILGADIPYTMTIVVWLSGPVVYLCAATFLFSTEVHTKLSLILTCCFPDIHTFITRHV